MILSMLGPLAARAVGGFPALWCLYALVLLAKLGDEGWPAATGPGFEWWAGSTVGPGVAGVVRTATSFEALGGLAALIIAAAVFAYAFSSFP